MPVTIDAAVAGEADAAGRGESGHRAASRSAASAAASMSKVRRAESSALRRRSGGMFYGIWHRGGAVHAVSRTMIAPNAGTDRAIRGRALP